MASATILDPERQRKTRGEHRGGVVAGLRAAQRARPQRCPHTRVPAGTLPQHVRGRTRYQALAGGGAASLLRSDPSAGDPVLPIPW